MDKLLHPTLYVNAITYPFHNPDSLAGMHTLVIETLSHEICVVVFAVVWYGSIHPYRSVWLDCLQGNLRNNPLQVNQPQRARVNIPRDSHDDVIKWKHFLCYWPFVREIHRSPVNSLHKGQWRGALMFSLICEWTNGWVSHREAGDLRRHCTHYDVIVMNIHHPNKCRTSLSFWYYVLI